MNTSPKYNFPWDLIAESLTGNLTIEEELQLQQWFTSDPENQKKYLHIRELWENGMEDYKFYRMANENEAWKALQAKIGNNQTELSVSKEIEVQYIQKNRFIRNLISIAAIFLGLVGFGLWLIIAKNSPVTYETGITGQRKVLLSDGSSITLQPQTKIQVLHHYNKSARTIIMAGGEAYFNVVHESDKPFIVELGTTQIKDIGTSFTIQKEAKEIDVSVSSGKVVFVKIATKETRELTAGSGISYDVKNEVFGETRKENEFGMTKQMLNFENTSLTDVIISLEKAYGKKVIVNDGIGNKKFTAQLDGMSFNTALKVICKSLGLEYSIVDSVYLLNTKNIEQP